MIMEPCGKISDSEKKYAPKTNPTCIALEQKFGLRGERTATKCLSHGTTLRVSMLYHINGKELKGSG
jgi:hypothetical protein